MSSFCFKIEGESPADTVVHEFANIAETKCQAVQFAAQLICDQASTFWPAGEFALAVTDEKGLVLFTLTIVGIEAPAIHGR